MILIPLFIRVPYDMLLNAPSQKGMVTSKMYTFLISNKFVYIKDLFFNLLFFLIIKNNKRGFLKIVYFLLR